MRMKTIVTRTRRWVLQGSYGVTVIAFDTMVLYGPVNVTVNVVLLVTAGVETGNFTHDVFARTRI